ncbi:MAG TPA: flagellar motor switch phosphatase FliY [Bacillales bacterium]|nr:flagellar motor switch phosphatase FliY [Bacillales bacterium]
MSDGQSLSQEEIDALLNGQDAEKEDGSQRDIGEFLSMIEVDTLGEIGNISFGSAATALSELLNQKVEITTPELSLVERNKLNDEFPHPHVAIIVEYTEGFRGSNVLVMKLRDASVIANLMMGGDGQSVSEDIGEMEMSAVQEAMNQMMGSASTSMSTVFNLKIDISPPKVDVLDFSEQEEMDDLPVDDDVMLKVSFNLKIGTLIDSNIMQLLPIEFARDMVSQLVGAGNKESEPEPVSQETDSNIKTPESAEEQQSPVMESPDEREPGPAVESSQPAGNQHLGAASYRTRDIQSAVFSDFEDTGSMHANSQNLNMLFDIPLQVTVELGRTKRTVKDILNLSPGSVIELDKLAGEPVDIYVNNKMVAKGEVVVIDENFGVRVTEIASRRDRIQKLQ